MKTQLSERDIAQLRAEFDVGASQGELARRFQISKSTVNKYCKGRVPKNAKVVDTLVEIEQHLKAQDPIAVREVRYEVDRRLRDMEFFRESSLLIAAKAVEMSKAERVSMFDLEKAQNIIGKGKENIYGKAPDTAIQINNGADAKKADLSHLTLAEKLEIKRKVFKTAG